MHFLLEYLQESDVRKGREGKGREGKGIGGVRVGMGWEDKGREGDQCTLY